MRDMGGYDLHVGAGLKGGGHLYLSRPCGGGRGIGLALPLFLPPGRPLVRLGEPILLLLDHDGGGRWVRLASVLHRWRQRGRRQSQEGLEMGRVWVVAIVWLST